MNLKVEYVSTRPVYEFVLRLTETEAKAVCAVLGGNASRPGLDTAAVYQALQDHFDRHPFKT